MISSDTEAAATPPVRSLKPRCPPADFEKLVARYSRLVCGTAARVLRDPEEARDVAQAVFADFLRLSPVPVSAPDREEGSALGGWLHRHTVFLALRRRTANRRRALREAEAQRRWSLNAPGRKEAPEWIEELDAALGQLSEEDRLALIARYLEDQPLRALAQSRGISEDAAQKRVSRALERLRGRLERRGVTGVSAAAVAAAVSLPAAPVSASALAAAALQGAAVAPAAGAGAAWTVFLTMNLKHVLTGAGVAALLTTAGLAPVLLRQRAAIPAPEQKPQPAAADTRDTVSRFRVENSPPATIARSASPAGGEREIPDRINDRRVQEQPAPPAREWTASPEPAVAAVTPDSSIRSAESSEWTVANTQDAAKIRLGVQPAVMKFDKPTLTVKPGQKVMLLFQNQKCPLQHNFLLLKPGKLQAIGAMADRMLADPKALEKAYVPESPDVIAHGTKLIGLGQTDLIEFTAPAEPGDYPYVCTFPGHWRLMNGVLKVAP